MKDTILVTGSRDFRDAELIFRELEMWAKELFLVANHPPAMVSSFAPPRCSRRMPNRSRQHRDQRRQLPWARAQGLPRRPRA